MKPVLRTLAVSCTLAFAAVSNAAAQNAVSDASAKEPGAVTSLPSLV